MNRKSEVLTAIKESLLEEKASEFKKKREEEVLDYMLLLAKLELPGALVEQEIERIYTDLQRRLSQLYGKSALIGAGRKKSCQAEEAEPDASSVRSDSGALDQVSRFSLTD